MITIHDPGQTLTDAQTATLVAKSAAYPFDVFVEIDDRFALSRASFEHQVALHVTPGSRVVSVGVSPVKHFSFVHSSGSLGVPPGPQVAQAGNAFFRQGNLVDGIDAILAKANELRVEPRDATPYVPGKDERVVQSQAGVPIVIHEHHTASGVWWGVSAFVVAVTAVVLYAVWRARKARLAAEAAEAALATEAAELAARNVEESTWHDQMKANRQPTGSPATRAQFFPPMGYAPSPTVVVQNNSNDLLLGYELCRMSEPRVVERQVEYTPAPSYEPPDTSSSSDYGGGSDDSSSSSSFDSGSDSSSSSDSGGGGDSSSGSDW